MKKVIYLLKLLALVLYLVINTDAGIKEEWYITFYEDENTIHKVARDQYLEMKEFFEINEYNVDYINYLNWEYKEKFKNKIK